MQDPEKKPQPVEAAPSTADKPLFPETDLSCGIVGWDGQDDPTNPQNFSPTKKWSLLALISSVTLISPLASSMFSPAVGYMAAEFGESDQTLLAFSVSIFLLGYTVSSFFPLIYDDYANIGDSSAPYSSPPSVKSTAVESCLAVPIGSSSLGKLDAPWPRISLPWLCSDSLRVWEVLGALLSERVSLRTCFPLRSAEWQRLSGPWDRLLGLLLDQFVVDLSARRLDGDGCFGSC